MIANDQENSRDRFAAEFETDMGTMFAVVNAAGALVRLTFGREGTKQSLEADAKRSKGVLYWNEKNCADTISQVRQYLAGERKEFDLSLEFEGTDFQKQVWSELVRIPYGHTMSYGELAKKIGRPSSSRAVGAANGANLIAIVVPCHRVIGANGKLTGYAFGVDAKERLLSLEQGRMRF